MKLSEFKEKRRGFWIDHSNRHGYTVLFSEHDLDEKVGYDVLAAEASGKTWDPEEVELPKRLAVCFAFRGEPKDLVLDPGDGVSRPRRARVLWYEEAARRYNNYEEAINYLKELASDFGRPRQILDSIGEEWRHET